MELQHFKRNYILKEQEDKIYLKGFTSIIIFILINALKICMFNVFLLSDYSIKVIFYKFLLTLLILMVIFPIILNSKSRYLFLLAYILQATYMITNLSYFLYFHSYLQILQWISLFKEGFISTLHFSNPQNIKILIAFIDLPFALYIFIKYYKIDKSKLKLRLLKNISIALTILTVISVEIISYINGYSLIQYIGSRYSGETIIVERYGTVVNSVVNIIDNSTEEKMIQQFKYGKEVSNNIYSTEKPNFVAIQVESMDSNVINKKYRDQYIAPFLQYLSQTYVYYPYVLSYHKGGGTSDSEFSIINSIESLDAFPAIKLANYTYPNSLVSRLSQAGYKTLAFHGNLGSFYNRDEALPKMGFQEFFDISKMNMKDVGWGAPDNEVFEYSLDTMSKVNQPFFSYIITMTSHGPFTNVSNYYNNSNFDDIEDETTRNYLNSISYVDKSLENLISKIQANFKNTYIIIYGDHTPNVDTEIYSQASFSMDNRYFEFVPLLIITPDHKQYKENNNIASFLDISPTILNASGIPFTIDSDGQNLLEPDNNKASRIPYKEGLYDRDALYNMILNK